MMKTRSLSLVPLLVAGLLALPGCALLQGLLGPVPKPTASITGIRITDFSLSGLTLNFDVAIANPYAVPLPLVNVDYALASASQPFLQGQAAMQGEIPANGSKTVTLPAKIAFGELLKVLQGVRPGATIPYRGTLDSR